MTRMGARRSGSHGLSTAIDASGPSRSHRPVPLMASPLSSTTYAACRGRGGRIAIPRLTHPAPHSSGMAMRPAPRALSSRPAARTGRRAPATASVVPTGHLPTSPTAIHRPPTPPTAKLAPHTPRPALCCGSSSARDWRGTTARAARGSAPATGAQPPPAGPPSRTAPLPARRSPRRIQTPSNRFCAAGEAAELVPRGPET